MVDTTILLALVYSPENLTAGRSGKMSQVTKFKYQIFSYPVTQQQKAKNFDKLSVWLHGYVILN